MTLRGSTLLEDHHPHRDGGTCRRFFCGCVGPSTFASYDKRRDGRAGWVGYAHGLICPAHGLIWGVLNKGREKWRLRSASFCISAQLGTDLKATVTCPAGLHSWGEVGKQYLRASAPSQTQLANNATGPARCEIVPIHSEQDTEHLIITQLKHLLKIQKNYLDNYSLEYPAIQSLGWYKNWCWPLAYEYNLELIVKCARPCKKMGNSARIRSIYYLISRDHCCWQRE